MGMDFNKLMQQAQQMQEQLHEAQQRLADTTVDGSVAGGAVTVTVNGVGELTAVSISPEALDGDDADAFDALGDLVVAAYRDARAKADALAAESFGPITGGLPGLPGDEPGAPGKLGF